MDKLPTKEFGVELTSTERGEMYWSGCSLDKEQLPIPAAISFPVTTYQNLNLTSNGASQTLLNDLARVLPNPDELIRRQQQIQAEHAWGKYILSHLFASLTPIFMIYCCHQCGI